MENARALSSSAEKTRYIASSQTTMMLLASCDCSANWLASYCDGAPFSRSAGKLVSRCKWVPGADSMTTTAVGGAQVSDRGHHESFFPAAAGSNIAAAVRRSESRRRASIPPRHCASDARCHHACPSPRRAVLVPWRWSSPLVGMHAGDSVRRTFQHRLHNLPMGEFEQPKAMVLIPILHIDDEKLKAQDHGSKIWCHVISHKAGDS